MIHSNWTKIFDLHYAGGDTGFSAVISNKSMSKGSGGELRKQIQAKAKGCHQHWHEKVR